MDLLRASDALTSAHAALEIATELESPRLQVQAMQLLVKESWLGRALGGQRNFDKKYIRFCFEGVQAAAIIHKIGANGGRKYFVTSSFCKQFVPFSRRSWKGGVQRSKHLNRIKLSLFSHTTR